MGVTYKLKVEIIEYILQQKRENPQISCRKLVLLVRSMFGVNVSKSSVNEVMKGANLSSPVGRPPADQTRSKKFIIPEAKKVQLFGDGFDISDPSMHDETIKPKQTPTIPLESSHEYLDLSKKVDLQPSQATPEEMTNGSEEPSSSSGHRPISKDVNNQAHEKATLPGDVAGMQEERFEIKNMRPLFMCMGYKELFPAPILGEFFKRHTSLGEEEIRIIDVLSCLSPHIFEDPSQAFDPQNIWLWKFRGWDELPQMEEVEALVRSLTTTNIPKFDFLLELGYFFSMVRHVKMIFYDKQEIFLDGRLMFIDNRPEGNFPACPIERAAEEATRFIDGKQALAVRCLATDYFKETFLKLWSCLSFTSKGSIKEIILYGEQEEQLLDFQHIPMKKRHFIVSALIPKERFKSICGILPEFDDPNNSDEAFSQEKFIDSTIVFVHEVDGRETQVPLRIVAVHSRRADLIKTFIGTIPAKEMSVKDIIGTLDVSVDRPTPEKRAATTDDFIMDTNSEITIAQGLIHLNKMVEEGLVLRTAQFGHDSDSFGDLCASDGYMIIGRREVKVHLHNNQKKGPLEKRINLLTISQYLAIGYKPKRISFF